MATEKIQTSRREFVKKAAYVPPAILTLKAAPAFAKSASEKKPREKEKDVTTVVEQIG